MASTINISIPEAGGHEHATITNFEVAASYNWMDKMTPVILVPGQSCLTLVLVAD